MHLNPCRHNQAILSAAYLLMGFTLAISQALLMREMLVALGGHELTLGLMLAGWLALEATGSVTLGRQLARGSRIVLSYVWLQAGFAVALGAVLALVYGIYQLGGWVPGRALGLPTTFGLSAVLLIPVGLMDGAMFAVACGMGQRHTAHRVVAVRRVYVLEALGGIVGGLAFTYLCIPYLAPAQMALLIGGLNLTSAAALLLWVSVNEDHHRARARHPWAALLGLGAALALAGALSPAGVHLQQLLVDLRWSAQDVRFYGESPYGNVVTVRQREQLTVFANGLPAMTTPVPDVVSVEELVHLAMLHVPEARHVLVLGGGLGGVLAELLRYPLESLTYAEIDPLLIQAIAVEPTALIEHELGDRRVRIEHVDGRMLARRLASDDKHRAHFDLILLNMPYATTLQLNRFYTVEMVSLLRELLAERGVIVYTTPGSTAYLSAELRDLNARLRQTLHSVLVARPIPDGATLWLASHSSDVLDVETDELIERWRALGVDASLIGPQHIALKTRTDLIQWFESELDRAGELPLNRDLQPYGLLDGLAYWSASFSPEVLPYLNALKQVGLPQVLGVALALLALGGIGATKNRRTHPVILAIACTGFCGMAIDLSVVLTVQVLHGYVYQLIGLLIAAFMAGLSLGAWLSGRAQARADGHKWSRTRAAFVVLEVLLLGYVLALPALLRASHAWGVFEDWLGPAYLLGLNVLGGLLVGAQFPLAHRLLSADEQRATDAAAWLYSADLAGAFVAAVLVSAALIPAVGISGTCMLLALLKATSLGLVWFLAKN